LENELYDANQSAEAIYARIYEVKGLTERVKMALDPTYVPQRAYKAGAAALGGVRTAVTSAGGFLGRAAAATRKAATKAMYKPSNGEPWNNAENFNASGATTRAMQLRGTAINESRRAAAQRVIPGTRAAAAMAPPSLPPPRGYAAAAGMRQPDIPERRRTRRRNHTRKGRKAGRR
jgi:hypothetical protein